MGLTEDTAGDAIAVDDKRTVVSTKVSRSERARLELASVKRGESSVAETVRALILAELAKQEAA